MSITPITEKTPACFGVMCERHKDYQRYHAVEQVSSSNTVIGNCFEHGTDTPLFVPIQQEEAA